MLLPFWFSSSELSTRSYTILMVPAMMKGIEKVKWLELILRKKPLTPSPIAKKIGLIRFVRLEADGWLAGEIRGWRVG
jgi:hypothetical protein